MLYYTPPSDECFNEMKSKAIELWKEVDTDNDKYGYASEKINSIKDIANVGDNFMYILCMFDIFNQRKLSLKLSSKTKNEVLIRMMDGGTPEYIIESSGFLL